MKGLYVPVTFRFILQHTLKITKARKTEELGLKSDYLQGKQLKHRMWFPLSRLHSVIRFSRLPLAHGPPSPSCPGDPKVSVMGELLLWFAHWVQDARHKKYQPLLLLMLGDSHDRLKRVWGWEGRTKGCFHCYVQNSLACVRRSALQPSRFLCIFLCNGQSGKKKKQMTY